MVSMVRLCQKGYQFSPLGVLLPIFLKNIFKGPDDPNYAIIIVKPSRIELENMGRPSPEVWESSN